MTFLETCRKYNKIVRNMRDAAADQAWDRLLEMDQAAQPYVDVLVNQSAEKLSTEVDDTVRILIAEIIAYQNEIAKLVGTRQQELKSQLSASATVRKLEKLYGV